MNYKIGKFESSIAPLELKEQTLYNNTLILGEEGSGKTNLASKIREYVIANKIPTIYLDLSDPDESEVESRYKHCDQHQYLRFEESAGFDAAFAKAIETRRNIYLAADTKYFTSKRDDVSRLSQTIATKELLENYYFFLHDVSLLNAFYTQFNDFLFYILNLVRAKKYGLTFLAHPHEIFESAEIKLLFTFLYLGKYSNIEYYNTSDLKDLQRNTFFYQHRLNTRSVLFNEIYSDLVTIEESPQEK